jgi:hypothetical protein
LRRNVYTRPRSKLFRAIVAGRYLGDFKIVAEAQKAVEAAKRGRFDSAVNSNTDPKDRVTRAGKSRAKAKAQHR